MLQQRRTKLSFDQTATPAAPTAPMAGGNLRSARERLAWTLDAVAGHLRIPARRLHALEEGDLSALPGSAYALGYVRSYAIALGLDPSEMVRRFKAEATEVGARTQLEFPAPAPERGLPAGAIALLGIVLAVGAYTGWYRLSGEGRLPAETVAAIPSRLASLAEQALPPSAPVGAALPAARDASVASGNVEMSPAYPPPPFQSVSPGSAAAAPVNPLPVSLAPVSTPAVAEPAAGVGAPGVGAPVHGQPRLVLRATADAWMQVRERNGAVLLNRVLKPGETWAVPAKPNLLLTTGNAAGTEVVFDGATIVSLGGTGAVRRDLILDSDQIKDGKLAQLPNATVAVPRASQ